MIEHRTHVILLYSQSINCVMLSVGLDIIWEFSLPPLGPVLSGLHHDQEQQQEVPEQGLEVNYDIK